MTEFKLPDLGENIASGDVVSLLVKEGDIVKPQQDVIEIETEKAVIPVPSSLGGKVAKIHVKPGETVKVGQVLLSLEEAAAAATSKPQAAPTKSAAKSEPPAKAAAKPAAAKPAPPKPRRPSPMPSRPRRRLPSEPAGPTPEEAGTVIHMNPSRHDRRRQPLLGQRMRNRTIRIRSPRPGARRPGRKAAGPRIGRRAIARAGNRSRRPNLARGRNRRGASCHEQRSAVALPGTQDRDNWGPIRRETMPKIRKTIAANMVRSAFTIPHLTNFDDADITELERIRKGSVADYAGSNAKLTSLVFVMKAVALALKQHPTLNASLDMENGEIVYKDYVNLGIAVDTERGLGRARHSRRG